jgi:putative ABC transport system permease protein
MPEVLIWFLTVLCAIVMASACFNYTSLTIARSFNRMTEVGIRKVLGATRRQVFGQFISEALVAAGLAFAIAYGFLELTIPFFRRLQFLEFIDVTLEMDWMIAGWFLAFTLGVGLLAGLLPAMVLSNFQPLAVLQKLQNTRLFRRIGLRKTLLVTQFAVSLVFMIILTIAWGQMRFAIRENFGANRSDILNVEMAGISYDKLIAEISRLPQVQDISATSHLMGTWHDNKIDMRFPPAEETLRVRDYFIDHRFIPNLGLELIAGENFPENPAQHHELFAIVNEKFLEQFRLGAPGEALNRALLLEDSSEVAIRGVVKDFLFKPLNYDLEPLLLRYDPNRLNVLNLKISGDHQETIAALESIWKNLGSTLPLQYRFYDDTARETFSNLRDILWIVAYFGAIGILIACLGLLGMAIYSAETRSKEISIRKVVGASAGDLVTLLSKGYFLLLAIAAAIALPVSYLVGKELLQTFAYHIPLDIRVFLPGVALLFALGAITIGSQTLKAARANPVEALRKE